MKAIDHTFAEIELPKPSPAGRDLLVKVEAISVNPVDTKQRKTRTSGSHVLGWDAAGTVEAVGKDVSLFKPGDAVYYAGDVTRPGCDSEFHLVDERIVGRKPKKLDFAQAAAMPLTSITAWEAFYDRMHVVQGKSMLIIGGAGGVGSIGIQLAKSSDLKVIATASRPETIAWVKELGADHVIDHRKDLRPQLEALGLKHGRLHRQLQRRARRLLAGDGRPDRAAGRDGGDRRQPEAAADGRGALEERDHVLGADVHAPALPDARHDRAAPPAQPGRRAARRRQAEMHAEGDALADQRRQPEEGARAARVREP